jgi:hypothetical protein
VVEVAAAGNVLGARVREVLAGKLAVKVEVATTIRGKVMRV